MIDIGNPDLQKYQIIDIGGTATLVKKIELHKSLTFEDGNGNERKVKLEFEPQKYVNYGMMISLISGSGCLLFLLYRELRRNK